MTKDNTTMISGNEENSELKARIEEIKQELLAVLVIMIKTIPRTPW